MFEGVVVYYFSRVMAVNSNNVDPAEESGETRDVSMYEEEDDLDADHEYEKLNEALDEISNCLDALEKQNDSLQEKLKELLRTNQQTESQEAASEAPVQNS